ncbi:hypothetical protein HY570_01045, partial [Candidatus Micrarchaeota archaeon]|nr:hypothetical protein [Candidatus Micrarchaeota archaeon]
MRKLAFIFILFLLFGCIEQSEVLFPEKAKLKEQLRADSDGDGIIDISNYKFEELRMKGNITLSKIIIVKGVKEREESVINISLVKLTKEEVSGLRDLLTNFNNSRESIVNGMPAESACRKTLGLDRFECVDRESCLKACYSPVCYKIAQGAGFQFLDEMQLYANTTEILDNNVNSAYELLRASEKEPSGDKTYALLNTLLAIRAEARTIANSDMFNENVYSACEQIPFDFDSLNSGITKLADRLGVEVVAGKPDKFEVSTYLILTSPNNTGFVANEIRISERVPEEIASDIRSIVEVNPPFTEITQEKPLILTWMFTDLGVGENQTKFILKKGVTTRVIEKDFIEKNIFYPQVSVK